MLESHEMGDEFAVIRNLIAGGGTAPLYPLA